MISRVGIGGWQAGGRGPWGAGETSDVAAAAEAIRHAVESGVNWVDTAASYGLGHSERLVAQALRPWNIGEEVFVFTKCGHPWRETEVRTDLSLGSIRAECEASLSRLGVDRIDLLQIHHEDPRIPVEEWWGTLTYLVDEGKVRWIGVSNASVGTLERCEAVRHVDVVQPQLSLLARGARQDVTPWCERNGTGVIVYSPLAGGLLVGRSSAARLPRTLAGQRPALDLGEAEERLRQLQAIADAHAVSVTDLALSWVLSTDGVTGAICGARNPRQVDAWTWAARHRLTSSQVADLEDWAEAWTAWVTSGETGTGRRSADA